MTEKGMSSQNPAKPLTDDQMATVIGGLLGTLCQFNDPARVRENIVLWATHDKWWNTLQRELALVNSVATREAIEE